jgi:hypothetical protein
LVKIADLFPQKVDPVVLILPAIPSLDIGHYQHDQETQHGRLACGAASQQQTAAKWASWSVMLERRQE